MLSFLDFLSPSHFPIFIYAFAFFPCSCFCFSVRKLRRSGCCDVISPRLQFRVASHPARSQARERPKFREQESQRGWQTGRKRAHASKFLCLRTVPEMIWVSFESKLTYALDPNRSMQSANAPHQQGPCRNQEQRKTQSQRGNQWKSHKTNKESWQSKTKLSGVRYKQI